MKDWLMGKRSDFVRRKNDIYDTPKEAVEPLSKFLLNQSEYDKFVEPCAGNGQLIHFLEQVGFLCTFASDLEPRSQSIIQKDAFQLSTDDVKGAGCIITNPPWTRGLLHPMIDVFRKLKPTWLLFDADWMHTKQSIPYIKHCSDILSIGRVKWIPDSPYYGKDNTCWYKFIADETKTIFHGKIT